MSPRWLVPAGLLLLTACAPNLMNVKVPFDSDPRVAVIYRPGKLTAYVHSEKSAMTQLVTRNEETDLPPEFISAAEIFTDILSKEYPLNNIGLIEDSDLSGYDFIIYFNLDSSYTEDEKKDETRLNFMVTIEMYDVSGIEKVTGATITAMSKTAGGVYDTMAQLTGVLPPLDSLDWLNGRVRRRTKKWIKQVKGSSGI